MSDPQVTEETVILDDSSPGVGSSNRNVAYDEEQERNRQQDDALLEIVSMIKDPNGDLAAIYKKLALQIAYLSVELANNRRTPTGQYLVKPIIEQIKALRELSHTLTESDEMSRKDVLNFDGEKFKHVLREIVDTFKKSLKEAGVESSMTDNILRIYRDQMAMKEGELRRDLARFDSLPSK